MREMFEFLKLLNKPFYVLSGSSYLKNSGIMEHPLYKGAIAIEKKNNLFKYDLDDVDDTNGKVLVCQYNDFFLEFVLKNFSKIFEKFKNIIYFTPDDDYKSEISFIFINKDGMKNIKEFTSILE